ncbi:ribosome silencing factor [Candidatus Proelusimicrobium volucris]|uniref:ribosome silencing factor n=1 Tax=Candidatus Proelusimicrobium volucris TaxID=3416225 RepID=UPI003D134389
MDKKQAKELVIKTARFIDDKKAEEVKVYDLCGLSSLCDYIVIGTATSTPHLDALDMDAGTELKKDGLYKNNRDGGQTTTWRVSDYGYFMMHIMTRAAREFYALDKIFSFGKEVKWQKPKKTAAKAVKKTAVKTVKKAVKKTVKAATKKTDKKTLKKAAAKTVKKSVKTAAKKTAKKTAKKSTK